MPQKRSFVTLSAEQTLTWYQHHMQVMHGYALALGLRAGLSLAEIARTFVEPWLAVPASLPSVATAQSLQQQALQIAEVLALTYGEERVRVARRDDTWTIEVTIADREALERYGAGLELHVQWLAEQLRLVCEQKAIRSSVWQDPEKPSLHISLSLGSQPENGSILPVCFYW
jgi:hypothetical protein